MEVKHLLALLLLASCAEPIYYELPIPPEGGPAPYSSAETLKVFVVRNPTHRHVWYEFECEAGDRFRVDLDPGEEFRGLLEEPISYAHRPACYLRDTDFK